MMAMIPVIREPVRRIICRVSLIRDAILERI